MEQFVELAKALGPAGAAVFAFLYWRADVERKEMTKLLIDTIPKMTEAIETCKASVDMLRVAVGGGKHESGD